MEFIYIVRRIGLGSAVAECETEAEAIEKMLDHYSHNKRGKCEYSVAREEVIYMSGVKYSRFGGAETWSKKYSKNDIKNMMLAVA